MLLLILYISTFAVISPLELTTKEKAPYQFLPIQSGYVKFRIKSDTEAQLILSPNASQTMPYYYIIIAGWKNTKSVIRKNDNKKNFATYSMAGLLDPNEFRGFWLNFDNGNIQVGREGDNIPFLDWSDTLQIAIGYLGVRSGAGGTGQWLIEPQQRSPLSAVLWINDDLKNYQFGAKTTKMVHLFLTTTAQEQNPMYEIFIGAWSNRWSAIRKNGVKPNVLQSPTNNTLKKNVFNNFWLKFDQGNIQVGKKGEKTPFLNWTDSESVDIKYLGLGIGWAPKMDTFQYAQKRIINGVDAKQGQYPYAVSLRYNKCHQCGGSIIAEKWVLTSANCIIPNLIDKSTVLFGTTLSHNCELADANTKTIKRYIVHEEHNKSSPNDIALLEMNEPFVFSANVQAVKLPQQLAMPPNLDQAVLVGFGGASDTEATNSVLQAVNVVILEDKECYDMHKPSYESTLCAGGYGRGDCIGDAGSPLIVDGTQYGIVSWSKKPCGSRPAVYTKVSHFVNWINKNKN